MVKTNVAAKTNFTFNLGSAFYVFRHNIAIPELWLEITVAKLNIFSIPPSEV